MRRAALLAALLAVLVPAAVSSAAIPPEAGGSRAATAPPSPSWAANEIAAVVAAGLMGPDVASFRPDDELTKGELYEALVVMGASPSPPLDPALPVAMRELDAKLVTSLGLGRAAWRFRVTARDAGLRPPAYLGTETVARLLGLRLNHPQTRETLERGPNQLASRAEAAYSLARAIVLPADRLAALDALSRTFALPELSGWQRSVLALGLRFVGFPYVWAGSSERPQRLWSATAPGGLVDAPAGFDCSGFLWRVFKLEQYPDAPQLAAVLRGRTTYDMSGEVSAALRVGFDALQPGDVLFFGARGTKSSPSEVGHSGMYVGEGWFVHSSSNGVTLQPLAGWYADRFAWARRPLAEAGLTAS